MKSNENITKILFLGHTGVGKSSLGNYIIGRKKFESRGGASRVTTQINGEISERDSYKDIYIIDSPGTLDTKLEDSIYLEQIKKSFQNKNAGVRAICLLLNFSEPRFTSYLQKQLKIYSLLFSVEDFWEHVAIIFTKAFYYTPQSKFEMTRQELKSSHGLVNDIIIFIQKFVQEINDSKKNEHNFKEIHIPTDIPTFFVDSDLENEVENIRTKKEVQKLIEWARKKQYLDLSNIKDNNIDPNYLKSEKKDDIVTSEVKNQNNSDLKIYIKKFFLHYKKTTFHNEIVDIIEPKPYKIEEIMEEEKETERIPITHENENYKSWIIEHKAVKTKKRIIQNEETKGWENIAYDINSDNSRFLYSDKIEEKTEDKEEKISTLRNDEDHMIQIYQHYNIIKTYKNDKYQGEKKDKSKSFQEKRIITKEKVTTQKKDYKNGLLYDEVKIQEKIIKEYDNGKKKEFIERTIGDPIKRFWKTIEKKKKYDDINGNITYHKINITKREYETDNNGNIKNKEDEGRLIYDKDDIVSYTEKVVTTNSYVRKMSYSEIQHEYPNILNVKIGIQFALGAVASFGLFAFHKYKVLIKETKEYEKTYDYKTKTLIETREGPTKSTQELLYS